MKKLLAVLTFLLLSCAYVEAQSTCTYITPGAVLTAAQWNFCFSSKNDSLGYTPLNKAGDVMTGPLITTAATTSLSGFNISPGVAPTVPANGDVWVTSAGIFVRVNGVTQQLSSVAGSGPITVNLNAAGSPPAALSGMTFRGIGADATVSRMEVDTFGTGVNGTHSCVSARGTGAAPTANLANDELCSFNTWGYTGAGVQTATSVASLRQFAAENFSTGHQGSYVEIATTPIGSTTLASTVRFENDGGITVPSSVTGGDKGAGTINVSSGYFVGGNAVADTASAPLSLNASTGSLSITGAAGKVLAGATPAFTATPVLGLAGTTGTLGLAGSTSGTITVQPQAAAGTYNFNLPTTAGTSGAALLSGGGVSSPMTWTAGALAIASGKTFTASNTITLAGTDSTTWTGPGVNATLAALNIGDQTVTGGANVTPLSQATGSITVDCGARPIQTITNGGAFTITAPTNPGYCVLDVTNNATAGAITFTGFSVGTNTGDALTTTNTNEFFIFIYKSSTKATYSVKALQ